MTTHETKTRPGRTKRIIGIPLLAFYAVLALWLFANGELSSGCLATVLSGALALSLSARFGLMVPAMAAGTAVGILLLPFAKGGDVVMVTTRSVVLLLGATAFGLLMGLLADWRDERRKAE